MSGYPLELPLRDLGDGDRVVSVVPAGPDGVAGHLIVTEKCRVFRMYCDSMGRVTVTKCGAPSSAEPHPR